MEYTGERYIPTEQGNIRYEHLHRYFATLPFIQGKDVLDIACGEGYGSSILSEHARSVIGVDIDTECIEFAQSQYRRENIRFLKGSCVEIPVESLSIDVVVSFETIEHHDKHDEMIEEIKRILKPDGILIISSPNKDYFQSIPGHHNPFHIKELNYEEIENLLNKYLKYVSINGQRLVVNSLIMPINEKLHQKEKFQFYNQDNLIYEMVNPYYFFILCSDLNIENSKQVNSLYLDKEDIYQDICNILKSCNKTIGELRVIEQSTFNKIRKLWMKLKKILKIFEEQPIFSKK